MQWPILMKHLKIRNLAWRLGHRSEGTCKVTWSLGDSKLRRKGPKLVWAFKLLDSFAHKSTLRHTNQLEEILYRFWLWVTCSEQQLSLTKTRIWNSWSMACVACLGNSWCESLFQTKKIERKHFFCWIFRVFFVSEEQIVSGVLGRPGRAHPPVRLRHAGDLSVSAWQSSRPCRWDPVHLMATCSHM